MTRQITESTREAMANVRCGEHDLVHVIEGDRLVCPLCDVADPWFVGCGQNEGSLRVFGPYWTADDAELDVIGAGCAHTHLIARTVGSNVFVERPPLYAGMIDGRCLYWAEKYDRSVAWLRARGQEKVCV